MTSPARTGTRNRRGHTAHAPPEGRRLVPQAMRQWCVTPLAMGATECPALHTCVRVGATECPADQGLHAVRPTPVPALGGYWFEPTIAHQSAGQRPASQSGTGLVPSTCQTAPGALSPGHKGTTVQNGLPLCLVELSTRGGHTDDRRPFAEIGTPATHAIGCVAGVLPGSGTPRCPTEIQGRADRWDRCQRRTPQIAGSVASAGRLGSRSLWPALSKSYSPLSL
jgi:hypothetical protein